MGDKFGIWQGKGRMDLFNKVKRGIRFGSILYYHFPLLFVMLKSFFCWVIVMLAHLLACLLNPCRLGPPPLGQFQRETISPCAIWKLPPSSSLLCLSALCPHLIASPWTLSPLSHINTLKNISQFHSSAALFLLKQFQLLNYFKPITSSNNDRSKSTSPTALWSTFAPPSWSSSCTWIWWKT